MLRYRNGHCRESRVEGRQNTVKVALMQEYRWPRYANIMPFYLPAFAIYSFFFLVFFGLATAGSRYQYSISYVVPMTVTSELLTCRFDNDKPAEQNKNSVRHYAPCDDVQQAERLKNLRFTYIKPTLLRLKLRSLSLPLFDTQLETSSNLGNRYRVGQTVQIRLAKQRSNEKAQFASEPPPYESYLLFFKITLSINVIILLILAWKWVRANRTMRKSS